MRSHTHSASARRTILQLEVLETRNLLSATSGVGALPVLPNFPNQPSLQQLMGDFSKLALDAITLGADATVLYGEAAEAPVVLTLVSAARSSNSLFADLGAQDFGQALIDLGGVFGNAATTVISDFTTLLQDGAQVLHDADVILGLSQPSHPTPPTNAPPPPATIGPPSTPLPVLPPSPPPPQVKLDPDNDGDFDIVNGIVIDQV